MPFVIDASIAASWLLPDEGHAQANRAFAKLATDHALVPSLWWYETRNIFIVNERRGRIDTHQTTRALALLAALPIVQDFAIDQDSLLLLARVHRLTVYDAAYLELAQRVRAPLATLDNQLIAAATAEAIPLL
jgi:predicted nucleic acid-binding protein